MEFAEILTVDKPILSVHKTGYSLEMYLNNLAGNSQKTLFALGNERGIEQRIVKASIDEKYLYREKQENVYNNKKLTKIIDNENLESKVKYYSVANEIDLEYVLEPSGVKENIVLNSKKDNYEIGYVLKTQGLSLTICEDGKINATNDDGKIIYSLPAPIMYDSAGTMSLDVRYSLCLIETNVYLLSVIADKDWINHQERTFPVVIDPTVIVNYSSTNFRITRIDKNNATSTAIADWDIWHNWFGASTSRLVLNTIHQITHHRFVA